MTLDKERLEEAGTWVAAHKEEFVRDLAGFVAIPSVSEKQDGPYPFGKACADNIDFFLGKAASFGLLTENLDYYAGKARLAGSDGTEVTGIFGHGDVVPAAGEWIQDPFTLWQKDEWLIGRGVGDNKGGSLGALYAMRFFKEKGIQLKNHVDLYLGSAEETGMEDIRYLKEKIRFPDFSLVPDARFPVCYGEKGMLKVHAAAETGVTNLTAFSGGKVSNVVAAEACATLEGADYDAVQGLLAPYDRIRVTREDGQIRIYSEGIAKHSAFPEGGLDAIGQLARALSEAGLVTGKAKNLVDFIGRSTQDFYGNGIGIGCFEEDSGRLVMVLPIVRLVSGKLEITYNIRYPVRTDGRKLEEAVAKSLREAGFTELDFENDLPFYREPDEKVKFLADLANQVLGQSAKPYILGGGTYARMVPGAVGYGFGNKEAGKKPPFPEGQGRGHEPNEAISLNTLLDGIRIYILALWGLDGLEK